MSDITGSSNIEGATVSYDINPTAETAKITVKYGPVTLGTVTLTSSDATASVGGSVSGTEVKMTLTANWSAETITYSMTVDTPLSKKKTYSGTLVHW